MSTRYVHCCLLLLPDRETEYVYVHLHMVHMYTHTLHAYNPHICIDIYFYIYLPTYQSIKLWVHTTLPVPTQSLRIHCSALPFSILTSLFSDREKPGCNYSLYTCLLAQSCLCGINSLPCPPPSHKDTLLPCSDSVTVLAHHCCHRSLPCGRPSHPAGLYYLRPGQYHLCAEIPSQPQSSSGTSCQAGKHSPYSS